jgi:hypothetical protein
MTPEEMITDAVREELEKANGDIDTATQRLVKRAIPDAMQILDATRKGARYELIRYPEMPEILTSPTATGSDDIWEARPKWRRPAPPDGPVTVLDVNGAYLAAFKTHLPLGRLQHSTGNTFDRRRAGVHLITPPDWEWEHILPNPIGNRDTPGPVWIAEPTLRLLYRVSEHGLCAPPVIHESWTSGSTENLLERMRTVLRNARLEAIKQGDDITLEYVKAMYSKFVSTLGESNYNRQIYRQDWMHCIRSQAFANLYMRAIKAYTGGCPVMQVSGTDELHVTGEWQRVFTEGRDLTEMKAKVFAA